MFIPPPDHDLYDLPHANYYEWGIDASDIPSGETITGATLFFDNIKNWNSSENDLWVHLLDSDTVGIIAGSDNSNEAIDAFAGEGILLNHWEDLPDTAQDITYNFENPAEIDVLVNYLNDNIFGIGFDPDCHYYNDGITLTIHTTSGVIPEPGTMFLLGSGLIGLAGFRRRFKKQ